MGNSQTSYCFVQPGSVRLLNARKDRQNANIGNQDLLFTNNFWGTLVNCSKLLMDSLPQDLQCYRLMIHQPSSLKTSMTSFKELSALGTSYRELPKLVLVTLSPAKQFCTSVHHVIKALSTNSWPLDPMPTRLLKDHLDDIVPTTTAVTVCESLLTGVFPTCLKQFLIRPLLKKPDLDKEILKNYRPMPNILFLAKIIKKGVAPQTYSYLEANNLILPLQSASVARRYHI